MNSIFTNILLISFMFSQEDCDGERYINEIFTQVDITHNVLYGGNYNTSVWGVEEWQDLFMDIYEPSGDVILNRPLVIFLFGGSFISGSKTNGDIVTLCTRYAKMGYVAVAIDYRLTTQLIWSPDVETAYIATAKGIHDVKGAIRWFRMNISSVNEYNIDSNRIYIGGVSAGAIVSVNAAYLDQENEIPNSLSNYFDENGGLEGYSGNQGYSSDFYGVVNLCGAIADYNWISENNIPIVSVHGTEDTVVPYGDGLITLFGLNMQVYGSYIINEIMLSNGNFSDLYTFQDYDHNPFNDSNDNMDITVSFTSAFMEDVICSYNEVVLGDLNNDFVLNIQDIIIMINIVLGAVEFSPNADLNSDGIINILDVVQLMNLILYV